jgi:type III secretory pathway lipoprotein EscJ
MDSSDTPAPDRRPLRPGPAQVIALGLVAASIGWGAWLLRDRPTSEEVELLPGTVLPSSELAIVEAAFDRAQLAGHRTEDGRVWVPRARQSAYMRALVDAEALPREFGSSLRRALERNSPWQSRAAQEEMLRVAVQEELAHVICSMPGIERAAVLYDVEDRPAFDGSLAAGPTRTASVNVRTQPDVELEPARVQAIRVLVAASIAGLAPERVAVTDLRSGRVHAGPLTQEMDPLPTASADPAVVGRISLERHLAAKVRQAISFVKGAVVDVTVSAPLATAAPDLGPPAPRQRVADANAPAEVAADTPPPAPRPEPASDSIVVSLAVPDTWFDAALAAARQRDPSTSPAASARVEEDRLREHVLQSLPPAASADDRRVVITRFPVAPPRPQPTARPAAAQASASAMAAPAQAAAPPQTVGDYIDVTVQAVADGRFGDVPREVWMVVTAKCSAVLAYLLFRGHGRGHAAPEAARRPAGRRIDWSAIDDDEPASRDESRRMAA